MKSKSIRIPSIFAITLLAFSLSSIPARSASPTPQTLTGEVTDTICAQSGSHAAMMAKNASMGHDSATCTKQCTAMGAKYVFVTDGNKAVYNLDDQAKAQSLAGHKVRVSGVVEQNQIKVASADVIS